MVARPAVLCDGPRAVAPTFTIDRCRFDRPQADGEFNRQPERARECSPPAVRKDDRMESSHLSGLSVYASGVYPVELSVGKRINGDHRIPVRSSVEVTTGEVRFYVDPEAIEILRCDADGH